MPLQEEDRQLHVFEYCRTSPTHTHGIHLCLCLYDFTTPDANTPTPVCVHIIHDSTSAQLHMLPNTDTDVMVIEVKHLSITKIPWSSLQLPAITTLTADGSEMSPALECFTATL